MTLDETESFYRCISDYRHCRQIRAEEEAKMLWDHVLELIKCIREFDGAAGGIDKLRAVGCESATKLRDYLEEKHQ